MKQYPRVLTIAGSDSGGGAGIQADIKTISATGGYAASAITAITVQNTIGVEQVVGISPEIVAAQIQAVISDIGVDAIKIGMLHSTEIICAIAEQIRKWNVTNVVLDPVMISTSGHKLIEDSAIEALKTELFPLARVITPNIPEAEYLTGIHIDSQKDLPQIAHTLSKTGNVSVLMKAGHATENELIDIFYNAEDNTTTELRSPRIETKNTHGTGCTMSSAFASFLAQGYSLTDAARAAKEYINKAILSGAQYEIGHGHGPVDHFFRLRDFFKIKLNSSIYMTY